ncbi:hypothetical protein [Sphingopyxis sp.]|uniref:hypothetical protein n=1 Tax=Sphingopyxis sp. TaxID=1908224 RepID=UPI00311FBC23
MGDEAVLFQDRVRERDLDNFLIEELHASEIFRSWIIGKLATAFDEPSNCEVRLQKSPPRIQDQRQTDVRIGWFRPDGDLAACVLIESKVTAGFQAGQAASYAAEVLAHRAELGSRSTAAILIAPASRLVSLPHDGAFDVEISIEEIIGTLDERLREPELSAELSARLTARIDLLEALCGRRQASIWTPVTIEAKRNFAEAYAALAAEILPDLSVRPSSDGPKALTRIFDGFDLKPEFPDVKLRHEFGSNDPVKYANVLFGGLADRASALNESGVFSGTPYKAEVAGKSLAVRVNTPGIDPTLPFERERHNVVIGLNAIRSLTDWLAGNRASIGEIALQQEEQSEPEVPERADNLVRYPTEAEFKEQLWATYRECEALGYKPTGMLEMMQRLGAIATAKQLLAKPPSEGFSRLAELGRLDLAIESIALEPRWSALFSEAELKIARRRLR